MPLFEGTSEFDFLRGSEFSDEMYGGAGNDEIWGDSGADTIYGGDGNDILFAIVRVGRSSKLGDEGRAGDEVHGDGGNDAIWGTSESATLYGGDGDDTFHLYPSSFATDQTANTIYGGDGYDEINPLGPSSTTIDWANGLVTFGNHSRPPATIYFEGIEEIQGAKLSDFDPDPDPDDCIDVMGDGDRNTFDATADAECFDGKEGDDQVSYRASAQAVTIDMRGAEGTGGDAAGDTFTSIEHFIGSDFDDILQGDDQRTLFDAGGGADYLKGGGGIDILKGEGGNDELIGDSGQDRLFGGAGKDTLTGGEDKDILKGGGKRDLLFGGDSEDELFGGGGSDKLDGGAGVDTLTGGGGSDRLDGGADFDTFFGGSGQDRILLEHTGEFANGGRGGDTADFSDATGRVTLFGEGAGVWNGIASEDTKLKSIENVVGSEFADIFVGTHGDDRIRGEAGNDLLAGGKGKNVLVGGEGVDTFQLGMGRRDKAIGGTDDDVFIINSPGALAANGLDPDDAETQRIILKDFGPREFGGKAAGDRLIFKGFDSDLTADDLLTSMETGQRWAKLDLPGLRIEFKGMTLFEFFDTVTANSGTITVSSDLFGFS